MKFLREIGPATLIAAAFIGPGTVSVCALAGMNHGYALISVMFVSLFMTIVLQELSARLAITFQKDLIELIRHYFKGQKNLKFAIFILIFLAIVFGNIAYEAGNLSGINIGLQIMQQNDLFIHILGIKINYAILIISVIAFIILHLKSYRYLEKTLMVLVGLLSLSFVITAVITTEDFQIIFDGMLSASFSTNDVLMVSALIGTTVVPYNLFLHASLAKQRWHKTEDVFKMRVDTYVAVSLGVLVSICIIITSANVQSEVNDISSLGLALKPIYGAFASYLLGIGYIAAGLTSAVTAPLAAAYVINALFNYNYSLESYAFKRLSYAVLLIGCIVAALDFNPIQVITIAQISNAIVLPILVLIIFGLAQKINHSKSILNSVLQLLIIILSVGLSLSSLYKIVF
ncbi:MAG: Nramp family divalent metal transporter [Psychroflexus sp.]|nr:Nramp family divalent metal transporter [Psychroflexus sp.]